MKCQWLPAVLMSGEKLTGVKNIFSSFLQAACLTTLGSEASCSSTAHRQQLFHLTRAAASEASLLTCRTHPWQ